MQVRSLDSVAATRSRDALLNAGAAHRGQAKSVEKRSVQRAENRQISLDIERGVWHSVDPLGEGRFFEN